MTTDRNKGWWRVPALVVALIAAFVLLRYVLPGPELTLAYLRALVWPFVLIGLLYALRERLLDKFNDLVEWAGFGQSLKFREDAAQARTINAEERLVMALEATDVISLQDFAEAELTHADDAPDHREAPGGAHESSEQSPEAIEVGDGDGLPESPADAHAHERVDETAVERERRRAVERAFAEGASWGYDMAKIGFRSRPRPVIEWTSDGHPIIKYGVGDDGTRAAMDWSTRDEVEKLENEIRRLDAIIENPKIDPRERLKSRNMNTLRSRQYGLLQRLKELDPDSPLLSRH